MDFNLDIFQHLFDSKEIIQQGGLVLILLVVFAENGLFFGFFLPGDTLLFTTGLLSSTNKLDVSLGVLLITICAASWLGSLMGYWFGLKTGEKLFKRDDSLFFKKKYIFAAEAFFTRYGGMALVMGRFLPIIRTFAPIFAGMVKFDFKKYLLYNVLGGTVWAGSLLVGGYVLGRVIPNAEHYLEYIILGIVFITWLPVIITYVKELRRRKALESESRKEEPVKH